MGSNGNQISAGQKISHRTSGHPSELCKGHHKSGGRRAPSRQGRGPFGKESSGAGCQPPGAGCRAVGRLALAKRPPSMAASFLGKASPAFTPAKNPNPIPGNIITILDVLAVPPEPPVKAAKL